VRGVPPSGLKVTATDIRCYRVEDQAL